MGHDPQVPPSLGDTITPSAHGPRVITHWHSPVVDPQVFTSQKATLTTIEAKDRTRKGQMRDAEE